MRPGVRAHRHDHETLPRQLFRQVVAPAAARERLPGWTRPDRLRVSAEHLCGALTVRALDSPEAPAGATEVVDVVGVVGVAGPVSTIASAMTAATLPIAMR